MAGFAAKRGVIFRTKQTIGDEMGGWIFDSFEWAMQRKKPKDWRENTPLITASKTYFDVPKGDDEKTATAIGQCIMSILNLKNRDIRFEALPALPEEVSHQYGEMSTVSGQYWHDKDVPLITYNPLLMRTPVAFINMLAHELMHAHLADVVNDLPGGEPAHELATDLHCITHGFGLFQLNAADTLGWAGYMSQPNRAFALAIFLQLTAQPIETAKPHLSGRCYKYLKHANRQIDQFWSDDIEALLVL